LTKFLRFRLFD